MLRLVGNIIRGAIDGEYDPDRHQISRVSRCYTAENMTLASTDTQHPTKEQEALRALYSELGTWRAVARLLGVNPGLLHRVANGGKSDTVAKALEDWERLAKRALGAGERKT